jgi:hypothetical protein
MILLWTALLPAVVHAQADPEAALRPLRRDLDSVETDLRSIEREIREVSRLSAQVTDDIAALEQEQSLGPVKRSQLSRLRQRADELIERQEFLYRREARVSERYARVAGSVLAELGPVIATYRERYQSRAVDSEARAEWFRRFETLVLERRRIRSRLAPVGSLLQITVDADADDTADSLRVKSYLLADVRDLHARLLSELSGWKRELEADREIFEEVRRLEEENEFFRSTDPLAPARAPGSLTELGPVELPPGLDQIRNRLDVPSKGLGAVGDFDRLIESIEELEAELTDDVLRMNEKRLQLEVEAERREEQE